MSQRYFMYSNQGKKKKTREEENAYEIKTYPVRLKSWKSYTHNGSQLLITTKASTIQSKEQKKEES